MLGQIGQVRQALTPHGMVFVHGELWKAEAQNGVHIEAGTQVEVVEVRGLSVQVKPFGETVLSAKSPE
jgi:membrane-bound serine protease (ClpP class)